MAAVLAREAVECWLVAVYYRKLLAVAHSTDRPRQRTRPAVTNISAVATGEADESVARETLVAGADVGSRGAILDHGETDARTEHIVGGTAGAASSWR